uniref:Coatomer subunit gamma n=1 Tax=Rhabditophanes sp. KR3021 TaxID=114890 RepID=A0AC35TLY8_9BILA
MKSSNNSYNWFPILSIVITFSVWQYYGDDGKAKSSTNESDGAKTEHFNMVFQNAFYIKEDAMFGNDTAVILFSSETNFSKKRTFFCKSESGLVTTAYTELAAPTFINEERCEWNVFRSECKVDKESKFVNIFNSNDYEEVLTQLERPHKAVDLAICYGHSFLLDEWQGLLTTIEMYRTFKANIQQLYWRSGRREIYDLLMEYQRHAIIKLDLFSPFSSHESLVKMGLDVNLKLSTRNYLAQMNDCFLKYRNAKYVMILVMRKDKKDDEPGAENIYSHLDKTAVLQEGGAFNDTPINAKKCTLTLSKLLYLIWNGETIIRIEGTKIFFSITKLWQSKDVNLRRLVYLAIKDLSTIADDVIIVTQSLTKDMTGKDDIYRAPAIRALCKITDPSMLQAIERYMKQAFVDRTPAVSSAALVSSIHIFKKSPEVVKRWVNEIQEVVTSDNQMVQFHALALLYHIRSGDRIAISKMIQKYGKSSMKSPLAICYLIRIAAQLIVTEDAPTDSIMHQFIVQCLHHKNEIVIFEGATAVANLTNVSSSQLASAISVLQLMCSSQKPTLRFAAVRTLNKLSTAHPEIVSSCNVDLEQLITDPNRSIATLAITTLLKTGAETSVDRLMKQISSFVSEISDEFKIVVIEAIRSLCVRYPRKHSVMMQFLTPMLRNEGGFAYKKAIVDTIIAIIEENSDAKEIGLNHLCEFIEDCEHNQLATKVLHILGCECPKLKNPRRYIRYIYNRMILEATQVRAAAVSALAKFGAHCPELRESIIVLLNRCLLDTDDEVRDRATFYIEVLKGGNGAHLAAYVLNCLQVSVTGLERALQDYMGEGDFSEPFDLNSVPVSEKPITVAEHRRPSLSMDEVGEKDDKPKVSRQDLFMEQLSIIPQFKDLGPLFRSSGQIQLTESVAEYNVTLIKHVFANHVVLQFDCLNTLDDQLLENVSVELEALDEVWNVEHRLPLAKLIYNQVGTTYSLLEMPDSGSVQGNFSAILTFQVADVDPTTGEPESDSRYDDSFCLEEIEISVADHVQPLSKINFVNDWELLGEDNEVEETYSLPNIKNIATAIKKIQSDLGMAICERSDVVVAGKNNHILLLGGVFRGGFTAMAKVKIALNPQDNTVVINIAVRSEDDGVSQVLCAAIA